MAYLRYIVEKTNFDLRISVNRCWNAINCGVKAKFKSSKLKNVKNIYFWDIDTVFWLASLHLWGNARNCGRQLSAQDLLLWVSRTLVQFRTNKTKSNLIENIIILIF